MLAVLILNFLTLWASPTLGTSQSEHLRSRQNIQYYAAILTLLFASTTGNGI